MFPGDDGGGAAGYIAGWRPAAVPPAAAAFAREVAARAGPGVRRARLAKAAARGDTDGGPQPAM